MSDEVIKVVLTIVVSIISLATLSVILSKQANTAEVLTAAGNFLSKSIGAAVKPVSGGLSIPSVTPLLGGG